MNKRQCIIVDLDGTLCDLTHRLHHLPDFDTFESLCSHDTVHEDVRLLLQEFQAAQDAKPTDEQIAVILCSGRSDAVWGKTVAWLRENGVVYTDLFMRATGDRRRDEVVKAQFLEHIQQNYDVLFTIDDRQRVVDMWREKGITCFQVRAWEEKPKQKYEPGRLTLMVGPSGAGKSTLLSEMETPDGWVVCTDKLREELCGNKLDQTKNDQVFAAAHAIAKARLEHGLHTIIDATNIRNKDRLAFVDLVPDAKVNYIVVDRPLEEKLKSKDWRTEELVRRHHCIMQLNLKAILAGDHRPNVTVLDNRRLK